MIDAGSLSQLCQNSEIIFGVCPPHAAEDVAKSDDRSRASKDITWMQTPSLHSAPSEIGEMMESNGIRFIDGGIIGGPAWKPKETWLYLVRQKLPSRSLIVFQTDRSKPRSSATRSAKHRH
ncbi:MAG: hypothetical protein MZV64_19120 [Ignavibacteriales bacterium]|nr:hypothetical protein [Ignavibacteriales bacterium]